MSAAVRDPQQVLLPTKYRSILTPNSLTTWKAINVLCGGIGKLRKGSVPMDSSQDDLEADEIVLQHPFSAAAQGIPSADPDATAVPITMLRSVLPDSALRQQHVDGEDDGDDGEIDLVN